MASQATSDISSDGFEPLHKAVGAGFNNEKYSDFVITCGHRKWHVHKIIVCGQSTWFENACTDDLKEAQEGVLCLPHDDPGPVEAMLTYMYTTNYDTGSIAANAPEAGAFHIAVFKIADRYFLPQLADLAVEKFATWAETEWDTDAFAEAVEEIFTDTPDADHGLREQAVEVAYENAYFLFTRPYGVRFREVVKLVAAFAYAYTEKLAIDAIPPHDLPSDVSVDRCVRCDADVDKELARQLKLEYICEDCGFCVDPKYSDLTVVCEGQEWSVHKIIVCGQSSFFDMACSERFKEGIESRIVLPDDQREVVEAMLRYLYTCDYTPTPEASPASSLVFHVNVYIAADKYDIPAPCRLATRKFSTLAGTKWEKPEFARAVELTYENTMDSQSQLRNLAVSIANTHAKDLRSTPAFCEVVAKVPTMRLDLWRGLDQRSMTSRDAHSLHQKQGV